MTFSTAERSPMTAYIKQVCNIWVDQAEIWASNLTKNLCFRYISGRALKTISHCSQFLWSIAKGSYSSLKQPISCELMLGRLQPTYINFSLEVVLVLNRKTSHFGPPLSTNWFEVHCAYYSSTIHNWTLIQIYTLELSTALLQKEVTFQLQMRLRNLSWEMLIFNS